MASILTPPSADYNVMLQDMSNYLARSQFLHRLSTQSSSTSGGSKRAPPRITKQNSAGNSPHNVQRRRTTANTARTYPRLSQSSPYQTQEQRLWNYYNCRQPLSVQRPMSWHPGSETISTPAVRVPTSEPALGNAIAELQNLAVSGQPTSSVQQSIENAFAMGYGMPISTPAMMSEQSPTGTENYESAHASVYGQESFYNESMYNPYSYNNTQQIQHSCMPQPSTQTTYPHASYPLAQWPETQTCFGHNLQNPQTSADLCQPSSNVEEKLSAKAGPPTSKRTNKVLSGIGLYDDKVPDFITSTNGDTNRGSMGKGLKLEETWQPPDDEDENDEEEDEDEEEDDGYSTDEGEEMEEEPPIIATAPQAAPTAFYPPYGDLSQQSFFFSNDDEPYPGEDGQYSNYLALGQAQPKPQDPVAGNFLWC